LNLIWSNDKSIVNFILLESL